MEITRKMQRTLIYPYLITEGVGVWQSQTPRLTVELRLMSLHSEIRVLCAHTSHPFTMVRNSRNHRNPHPWEFSNSNLAEENFGRNYCTNVSIILISLSWPSSIRYYVCRVQHFMSFWKFSCTTCRYRRYFCYWTNYSILILAVMDDSVNIQPIFLEERTSNGVSSFW